MEQLGILLDTYYFYKSIFQAVILSIIQCVLFGSCPWNIGISVASWEEKKGIVSVKNLLHTEH